MTGIARTFQPAGDFLSLTLSDGVNLYVRPQRNLKTVHVRVFIHRELNEEATTFALLAQTLMRGCRRYPTFRKIVRRLESLFGMSMGIDVLKVGERHLLAAGATFAGDRHVPLKKSLLAPAFDLLRMMLFRPAMERGMFRGDYVARERENLRRLISGMINDKMFYAYERALRTMCPDERYRLYEYGRLEDIDAVTPESLTAFHERVLASSPIDVFVAGDLDPGRVARIAERFFALGRRTVAEIPSVTVKRTNGEVRDVVETCPMDQSRLIMGWRTGTTWSDDDAIDMLFFNALLGAFPHSRLFTVVREREGLAYHADSFVDPSKGVLFVTAGIDRKNHRRAVDIVRAQIEEIASGCFTEEEVEQTRTSLVDRMLAREDHPSERIASMLPMTIHRKVRGTGELIDAIRGVTPDAIVRAARKIAPDTVYCLAQEEATP